MGSMIPSSGVSIEYMKPSSNIFQGEAFSPDTSLNSIFRVDNCKVVKESKEYLEDCKFNLKKVERPLMSLMERLTLYLSKQRLTCMSGCFEKEF